MKSITIILSLLAFAAASCKKQNKTCQSTCTDALVRWGGDPAADGTGWYLYVPGDSGRAFQYPDNLAQSFKVNDLAVSVCYEKTNVDFVCFCAAPYPKMVHITSISRR